MIAGGGCKIAGGMSEDSVAKSCSRHRQSNAKADKCKQTMFHVKHCLCFYDTARVMYFPPCGGRGPVGGGRGDAAASALFCFGLQFSIRQKNSNTPRACWRRSSRIRNHIANVSRETLRGTSGTRSDQETGGRLRVVYSCSAIFYCGLLLRSVQ